MQIYVHRNNQQLGPFTEAEIMAQLASGAISLQDHVWWQGLANWMPLGSSPLAATLPSGVPALNAPATHTSQLAFWSLVCACLSYLCSLLTAIPAIILGHLALGAIKKDPRLQGRGYALAGLIIGYAMTVITVVALGIYIAMIPGMITETGGTGSSVSSPSEQTTNSPDTGTNSTPAITP